VTIEPVPPQGDTGSFAWAPPDLGSQGLQYDRRVEDRLPPDPVKLLSSWMEWEKGETPPGRVMSNLKLGGMKELLEAAAEQARLAVELESY
jgi:hypothetical protein